MPRGDAGAMDRDAEVAMDASMPVDSSVAPDSTFVADASESLDAAVDASREMDASVTTDAAMDAGGVVDAGGAVDASPDSGATLDAGMGGRTAATVCARWNSDTADLSEGTWSGSTATCTAGDMTSAWRDRAMRQVNLFRWLSGLPDTLGHDATLDAKSQAGALMMEAQMGISHSPDASWLCYTADGAEAAAHSNLAGGSQSVSSIASYMVDGGNESTLGHRRWILSNTVGPFGVGCTTNYSVLWVVNGASSGPSYTAWPNPGYVPIEAWTDHWGSSLDRLGWSVQSDSVNLDGATASVTRDGVAVPTTTMHLPAGYGSGYALSIMHAWNAEVGRTYHVSLSGVATPIEYDVVPVDCSTF